MFALAVKLFGAPLLVGKGADTQQMLTALEAAVASVLAAAPSGPQAPG